MCSKEVGERSHRQPRQCRFVLEQFKTMHAYSWQSSVAFTNPRFEIQEVNKEGVLRRGRTPRTVPMLSVKPLRLPFLKSGIAAISLKDADERELCVPTAITHWLANRTGKAVRSPSPPRFLCVGAKMSSSFSSRSAGATENREE